MTTPTAQRSARLLGLSWGVSWAGVPIGAAFGSVIILSMTNDLALTGVAYSLTYLGSLLAAYPAGHAMDRYGRKPVLIAGHLTAALGYAIGTAAILLGNFVLFLASQLIAAMGSAATYLTRLAAADLYPPAERGRGLGRLVSYLVFGASGSVLLILAAKSIEPRPGKEFLAFAWALIPILSIIAALFVARVHPDPKVTAQELHALEPKPTGGAATAPAGLSWRLVLPVAATMLFAQATMASMMSVTGAALTHEGHGADFVIVTLTLHIIGMFGFSPFIGILGDRFGARTLLVASAVYLGVAALVTMLVPLGNALVVALIAVGIGWSFAFIGANTIIADTVPLMQRGRVMGGIDFAIAIVGGGASLAAGWALDTGGIQRVAALGFALAVGVLVAAISAGLYRRVPARLQPLGTAQDLAK